MLASSNAAFFGYCLAPADPETAARVRRLAAARRAKRPTGLMIDTDTGAAPERLTDLVGAEKLAVAQAILRLEALAAEAGEPPTTFFMRMLVVALHGRCLAAAPSPEGEAWEERECLEALWREDAEGIRIVADCAAVAGERIVGAFRPERIGRSRRSGAYRLVWDGARITVVQDYDFQLSRRREDILGDRDDAPCPSYTALIATEFAGSGPLAAGQAPGL